MKTGYKVCDAMTEKPVTISPDATIQECAKIMSERHVGALVIKNKSQLVGIITEQDIVRKSVIHAHHPAKTKAFEVMEKNMHTIEPEKDIFDALLQMKEWNIRHLPVVAENEMVGLLTLKDVLKIEPQLFDLLVEKFELREEENKPVNNFHTKEGICQMCGKYSEELISRDNTFVCYKCNE
ncbi:CBS domain-containing protein [Candidatus Woesearchaeota archaeon]|nr:CBS domain-containing protein [Candidatus Woesearchaeota archaeon]